MNSLHKLLSGHEEMLFFIAIIETIIIILLLLFFVLRRKRVEEDNKSKEKLPDIVKKKTEEVNYWRDAFYSANRDLSALKSKYERDFRMNHQNAQSNHVNSNIDPERAYDDYIKKEKEKGIYVQETTNDDGTIKREIEFNLKNEEPEPVPISIPRKYEFLEAANGGQFRKLLPSEEKCFFRTWEENGVRKFEFHGNVEKALANINAIFDDVCEIEGKQNGATQIINLDPGILTYQLKVDTPAKIKLI